MKKIVNNALFALLTSAGLVASVNAMDAHLAETVIAEHNAMETAAKPATLDYLTKVKEIANSALAATKDRLATASVQVNDLYVSAKNKVQENGRSVAAAVTSGVESATIFAKNAYHSGLQQVNNNKALIASGAAGVAAGLVYKLGVVSKVKAGIKTAFKNYPKTSTALATLASLPVVSAVSCTVIHRDLMAKNLKAAFDYTIANKTDVFAKVTAFTISALATIGIGNIATK